MVTRGHLGRLGPGAEQALGQLSAGGQVGQGTVHVGRSDPTGAPGLRAAQGGLAKKFLDVCGAGALGLDDVGRPVDPGVEAARVQLK